MKKSVAIIGGNLRNKGAWMMADVLISEFIVKNEDAFYFFTPFPEDLEPLKKKYTSSNLKDVIIWSPKKILISFLLVHIPIVRQKNKIIKSISNSDYVYDISGICFAEGRGVKHLVYNFITIYIPSFLKTKIIKLPQSFGPIDTIIYKFISKNSLKKCYKVFSRGNSSSITLERLKIPHFNSTDLLFCKNQFEQLKNKEQIIVSPSIIVSKKLEKEGINYVNELKIFIEFLQKNNYKIILLPNSVSKNKHRDVFDDSVLCEKIYNAVTSKNNLSLIKNDLTIDEIYELYKTPMFVVTSRFHSMILALNSGSFPIVLGWNHKYNEIMDQFHLNEYSINLDSELANNLIKQFNSLINSSPSLLKNRKELLENHKNKTNNIFKELS